MTPDEDFILDVHPQHSNIVIGAGFSGNYKPFGWHSRTLIVFTL